MDILSMGMCIDMHNHMYSDYCDNTDLLVHILIPFTLLPSVFEDGHHTNTPPKVRERIFVRQLSKKTELLLDHEDRQARQV